jgi:dipeptidyl aminopeptidase/acylaminoacyl peptidase
MRGRTGLAASATVMLLSMVALGCGGGDDLKLKPAPDSGEPAEITWGDPSGDFKGENPKGVVLLLHGGGWKRDPAAYATEVQIAPLYERLGYATATIGYGDGAQGLRDVLELYAKAGQRYPGTPICAIGASAGGTLALLLATKEPDLACVIDLAGPTDLTTLADQGGDVASGLAEDAFGEDRLKEFSPAEHAASIKAPVMLVFAVEDPVVPEQQGEEMKQALPGAKLIILPEGDASFIHGPGVDPAAKERADAAENAFLEQSTGAG